MDEIYHCDMLAERALRMVFIRKRVRSGCLPRIFATILLPVAVIQPPSAQITRTSIPGAPNT